MYNNLIIIFFIKIITISAENIEYRQNNTKNIAITNSNINISRNQNMTLGTSDNPEMPKIDKTLNDEIHSYEGDSTNVSCPIIGGNPYPTVTWFINNTITNYIGEIISFSTTKVQRSDKGFYECVATNEHGSDSHRISLFVDYAPEIRMEIEPKNTIEEGDRLMIQCIVDGEPKPEVKWLHNGVKIKNTLKYFIMEHIYSDSNSINKVLSFQAQGSDSGNYTCKAVNDRGEVEKNLTLTIYETVSGDFNLVIPCNTTGNPNSEIIWKRNNDFIEIDNSIYSLNSDGSLLIKYPNDTINGTYTCLIKNTHNDDWIESNVKNIRVLPTPSLIAPVIDITLRDGESRDIQCPLLNSKNITSQDYLRWYKDNKLYAEGSLKLNSVNYLNRGVYLCRISYWNKTESETAAVRITMTEAKPVFIEDEAHSMLKNSYRVRLHCEADGNPTPTIQWMHNGIILNKKRFTHTFNLNSQSSGLYQCIVRNELGSITRSFEV